MDGISTAKNAQRCEVSGGGTVIGLVEPSYGFHDVCEVLGQNPKM